MTPPSSSPRVAGRLQAIVLLMSSTLAVMAIVLLAPILPQLQTQFADEPGAQWLVPLIITMPALCLVLFAPVAGYLGDRYGRRRLLLIALALYALFGVSPMFLHSLSSVLVSRVLVGIAESGVLVLSTALITDYFQGEARDRWLGAQAAVSAVSAVVLFGVGGLLGAFGWRGPFALYGVSLVMLAVIGKVTWEPVSTPPGERAQSSLVPFPWRHMSFVCAISTIASIMFYVVQIQGSVALTQIGVISPPMIGLLSAIATIGTPVGTAVFRFNSRRSRPVMLGLAFALIGAGFLGISWAQEYRLLTCAEFVAQLGCGVMLPTLLTWAASGLDHAIRGRGVGLWEGIFALGGVLSAPAATLMKMYSGGLSGMFASFGLVNFAIAAAALVAALWSSRAPKLKPH